MKPDVEISLLPVNSFELESHLERLGSTLLDFGKLSDFSQRCMGVKDCDFIQCAIIEFISEIKTDFIAYYGVETSGAMADGSARIVGDVLPYEVTLKTAINARQRGLKIVDPPLHVGSAVKSWWSAIRLSLKAILFQSKRSLQYRRLKLPSLPESREGQFRLLMSTYNPNTIFTLTPIQDRLKERSDVVQLYIANRLETFNRLVALGYPNIINGFAMRSERLSFFDESVLKAFVDEYFKRYFPFGKATGYFKRNFYSLLRKKLLFLVKLYSPLRKVFEDYKPNGLLVSSCSTADCQLLIHLAIARGVRTIEMTHGMFQDTPLLKFQNVPVKLVWCGRQQDLMRNYRPQVICPIIGNPKHDDLIFQFKKSPPRRHYEQSYVLIASTPGNNIAISRTTYSRLLGEYLQTAREFPNLLFVLKLHPSEDLKMVSNEAVTRNAPRNFIIEQERNVYELIFHAEIVLVLTSTVGFEALLWEKKLICYTIANSDKWLPFPEYGLAKAAGSLDELRKCIEYFIVNESLAVGNPNRDYFAFSDGNAINKMMSFVFSKEKVSGC